MHAKVIDHSPARMRRIHRTTPLQTGSSPRLPRGYYRLLMAGTKSYLRSLREHEHDPSAHDPDLHLVNPSASAED